MCMRLLVRINHQRISINVVSSCSKKFKKMAKTKAQVTIADVCNRLASDEEEIPYSCAINNAGTVKLRSWLRPDTSEEVFNAFVEQAESMAFDSLVLDGCTSEISICCDSEELFLSLDDFDWFVEIEIRGISSPPVKIIDDDVSF